MMPTQYKRLISKRSIVPPSNNREQIVLGREDMVQWVLSVGIKTNNKKKKSSKDQNEAWYMFGIKPNFKGRQQQPQQRLTVTRQRNHKHWSKQGVRR